MKIRLLVALIGLFSSIALADVPTQLSCKNRVGDRLIWDFTVLSLPHDGKPGIIQGRDIEMLSIFHKDYSDQLQRPAKVEFFDEEDYKAIIIFPSDSKTVSLVKIRLYHDLNDSLGNDGADIKDKLITDDADVEVGFTSDNGASSTMICTMLIPKF